ncbi:ABC transporter ATP-binding protein [Methanosphaera sp.]|uniref:ABC transporter ATP-binding protein n=1 Tax=Methanosphaera sp. TaxID=2666342 RepID=UPI0025ECEA6A|nr:ABC transporter ATP-binding protein [Methanosphaera sp.]
MRKDRREVSKPNNTKKSIKQVLSLLKDYKLKLSMTFICAVISTLFTVISPLLIGRATTIIYDGITQIMNHTGSIDFESLYFLLLVATVLYVVSAVFTYLQSWFLTQISTDISYKLRKQLIDKVNMLAMEEFDKNKRGDILSRVTNDVDSLQTGITSTFLQFMTAIITLVGVFVMMLTINLWMTLVTVILVPISFIVISIVVKRSQKFYQYQLKYKGSVNSQIEETFTGQNIIRAFNQEEESFKQFKEDNDKWYSHEWKSQFYSSLMGPIMNFISNLSYVAIAVLGAFFVLEKAITVGDILAFFQYIQNFTHPIQQITRVMNIVQTALAATERIFEFLEIENEENLSIKGITDIEDKITFEHVRFGYDENDVIKDLSFTANKGEKVAIVGHTGAGKSTIIKLLMRFYDIKSGDIKIDGVNINEYDKNSLRSMVGMVLQDTWLFSDTIMENIRYGNLKATDEEVIEASKIAYSDHFIKQLPEGYNTVLNEDTDNISIGQKQLLTIARTVLANKKILILDEATSSVDTRTEKLIQEAMDKLMENKTSFIIAHRLSTIKNADKILVMDDGKIIEEGKHNELIQISNGYYKSLYEQFRVEGGVD